MWECVFTTPSELYLWPQSRPSRLPPEGASEASFYDPLRAIPYDPVSGTQAWAGIRISGIPGTTGETITLEAPVTHGCITEDPLKACAIPSRSYH